MSRTKIAGAPVMRWLAVALIPLLIFCYASIYSAAGKERRQVFRPIPANLRSRLIDQLNLYVSLRSTHQWGKLYDLYSRQYVARRWPTLGMTRDEFVRGNEQDDAIGRGDNLLKFKADKVKFLPETPEVPARAIIDGCGEYYVTKASHRVGRSRRLKSIIEATYEGGEWHLTDIVLNYRCEECEADSC